MVTSAPSGFNKLYPYFSSPGKQLNEWKDNVESKGMRVNMEA